MHPAIEAKPAQIAEICLRFHVRRLEAFGSAAHGNDFDTARGDANFLVEFEPDAPMEVLATHFALQQELEALLGRKVGLISPSMVVNPFVRATIGSRREIVYATEPRAFLSDARHSAAAESTRRRALTQGSQEASTSAHTGRGRKTAVGSRSRSPASSGRPLRRSIAMTIALEAEEPRGVIGSDAGNTVRLLLP